MPYLTCPFGVPAEDVLRCPLGGLLQTLDRRQLDRLGGGDVAGRPIADQHLHGRGQRCDRQRDRQGCALVASPAAAQPAHRVGSGEEKPGDDVAGDVHVRELRPQEAVAEQRRERMDVEHPAVLEPESRRMIHPGVDGDHHQRPGEACDRDRYAAAEVCPRCQTVPSVDVEPDEDRLHEEGEALDRKAEAEHAAESGREFRPQQAHLETQDRAGDDADGEQRRHHAGPAPGQPAIELIARAQIQPLDEQDDRRKRDPKADQRDMHRERQRLHLSRLQQIGLVYRRHPERAMIITGQAYPRPRSRLKRGIARSWSAATGVLSQPGTRTRCPRPMGRI